MYRQPRPPPRNQAARNRIQEKTGKISATTRNFGADLSPGDFKLDQQLGQGYADEHINRRFNAAAKRTDLLAQYGSHST